MSYCCSQCSFTAQFESALLMHRQLHHEAQDLFPDFDTSNQALEKSCTMPRVATSPSDSPLSVHKNKGFRLGGRASATRLLNNLKTRICRSKMLFSHSQPSQILLSDRNSIRSPTECTSKALQMESSVASTHTACLEDKETGYGCHLCPFEADRITVLDRHLLNHHKIGLENLLKLVMAKTRDGLSVENIPCLGIRQPYYKLQDEMIEEGEFIIETVAPKIKILKHASTNTEHNENDFTAIASELEKLFMNKDGEQYGGQDGCQDGVQDGGFMAKIAALNDYMCKFVNSSNALKKVLNEDMVSKVNVRGAVSGHDTSFNLGLGDRGTPRGWARPQSEKMERSRKSSDNRGDKGKMSSESFYF